MLAHVAHLAVNHHEGALVDLYPRLQYCNILTGLVETIVQYSFDKKIDLMLISDAIKDDEYFKMYIERDSEHHNLLKSTKQEDW